jgi:hypothetical protein
MDMPVLSLTDLAKQNVQSVQEYALLSFRSVRNLFAHPR